MSRLKYDLEEMNIIIICIYSIIVNSYQKVINELSGLLPPFSLPQKLD